jgi:hypothetical protein
MEEVGDPAFVADPFRHRFAGRVVDIGDGDMRTLTGEANGSGSADAGGPAGDQRAAPGKLAVQLGPRTQRSASNCM